MGSLIKDFQRDIVQSSKSTTELLRTAKLIAAKLGLEDINEWVNCELNGYSGHAMAPAYRNLTGGELQARNPVHGWLPVGVLNKVFPVGQPISELESLLHSRTIVVALHKDQNVSISADMGMNVSHWQQQIEFSSVQLKGIVSAIRDKLLDWSIELEKRGIMGEDMSFDENERKAAQSQVFHIQHFTGVLGNVTHSSVQVYDYSTLHQTLKDHNIPQPERNELENIMDELKKANGAKKATLLEKGKAWITKNEEFLGATASIVRKAFGFGE